MDYAKKFASKEFATDIQKMIDEMLLYEKICVEVCLAALVAAFASINFLKDQVLITVVVLEIVILILFMGAAYGFYLQRKKYEKEKDAYQNYVSKETEIIVE